MGSRTSGDGPASFRLAILVVCAAAWLPYLRTIPDYFMQDDFGGMQLIASKPWNTFPRWFTMPWMEFIWGYTPDEIRPFTALSYQLTVLGNGSDPRGHHVLNIVLHGANSALVLAIARAGGRLTLPGATAAALVFALLPLGAESVAWITGRVDSLPACFYLLSFYTYVRWRRRGGTSTGLYVWSLVWFFMALFSKQNTITLPAAIVAYDFLTEGRRIEPSWPWLRSYVPFAVMTAGFLALRYLLLGEVLREGRLASLRLEEVPGIFGRHVQRIIWWDTGPIPVALAIFGTLFVIAAAVAVARAQPAARVTWLRSAMYFGLVWVVLGLAPGLVAGYESPRHAYLAAAGWGILVGIAYDALRSWSRLILATAATGAIVLLYGVRLHHEVTEWRLRAAVAELATAQLEREVAAAPPGTLFIVGVPVSSWEWATPFVFRPPYTTTDLTRRASIVAPHLLHCCREAWWDKETRDALASWVGSQAPVVGLHVSSTGEVRRLTDGEDPQLRDLASFLPAITRRDNLDGAIQDILRKLVAGRGQVVHGALKAD